jgi:tetratricopeptide (TPR) repeat protein
MLRLVAETFFRTKDGIGVLMAKGILSCLKKRDLIQEAGTNAEALQRLGREYLSQNRSLEALEFFEAARDREGLELLKEKGLEEGDPFLYRQACKLLKINPNPADWQKIGEKARAAGRYQQALAAFKATSDDVRIKELESLINEQYRHDEPKLQPES